MPFVSDLNGGKLLNFTEDHFLNLIMGSVVLVIGIVLILLAVYATRNIILKKLRINYYFAKLTGRVEPLFDLEKTLLRVFYIVALLFVFNLSAQVSHIESAIEFFSSLLTWAGDLIGVVFKAVLPIALALIFSYLARVGVLWLGKKFNLDERLGKRLDAGEPVKFSVVKSLSEIAYGIIFLYFLPQILNGVGLERLSGPITLMFEQVVPFFSKLAAAIVILFLGWFIARLLKQIVEGLLVSFSIDSFTQKIFKESNILSSIKFSKIIPNILYVIVMLLVCVQALVKLNLDTITAPIERLLASTAEIIVPGSIAIFFVLAAVYFGGLFSRFIADVLKDIGFDNIYSKLGLANLKTGSKTPSQIIGFLSSLSIVVLVLMQALNSLGLENLSSILRALIVQFGNIALGVVVFAIGLYVARSVSSWVEQGVKLHYSKFLALVSRVVIIVISGAMALQQIGIADEIVTIAFALSMGSVALGVAIAIGLGAKDVAGEIARDFVKKFKG